ncbi:hypothetical protein SASPL_109027 [Salvia splendens]|uniref:S-acyltransferase n=1 Tax=Salvia splendens TaxID=180675 RepID=A0A8X8YJV8_SALSN|nr:probable protein S-acyltransferase 1 [Salvia splendens]KAG6430953.1 hypothetical protein SASPL_109027 [Salvia splendens]
MGGQKFSDFAPPSKCTDRPSAKKRLYQVWRGRNKFLCGGRLVFGPDAGSVLLSTVLIGGPALTFCIKMLLRISELDFLYGRIVLAGGFILTFLALSFLYMTAARNPGIVPRNNRPPVDFEVESVRSLDWASCGTPSFKIPRTKDVIVNGHTVKVKFCDTCLLYRPPRASHCSVCNNCVQRFDHHCPWVGQCIGVRNYRTFFCFVTTSTVLCIYVFTFSLLNLLEKPGPLWRNMSDDTVSVSLIVYCFISVWFVGGLSVFHSYLVSTNQTTYENFRYRYDRKENPYNRGIGQNIKEIFFSKPVVTRINFREWVNEADFHVQSISRKFSADFIGTNGKLDLELGVIGKDGKPFPGILQNLDYKGIEESLKKPKGGKVIVDPFVLPSDQDDKYTTGDSFTDEDRSEFSSERTSSAVLGR